MRIPKRGLVLAAGVAALPLSAKAECPPEASIDRYAQTAGDALSALNGLVPASQQLALEDHYAAMLVLKWNWQGAEGLIFDEAATGFLKSCIESGRCEATSGDDLEIDADGVPNAPSTILKSWAERVLECPSSVVVAAPIDVTAPETEPEREPDVAPVEQMVSAEPETTISEDVESVATDASAPQPEIEVAAVDTTEPPRDSETAPETETTPIGFDLTIPNFRTLASDIEQALPITPATGDPETLLNIAAASFAAGRPAEALAPLRTACLMEAPTTDRSRACETLFDVFNAPTARGREAANTPKYLSLSDELCEMGYIRGCLNLAQHFGAQTTAEAHVATVEYTERACSLGNGEACATVSDYYLTGRASAPDPALARLRLEQSCGLGRLSSCQDVADFYLRGVGGDADIERALEINAASCPEGEAQRPDDCIAAADFVMIHMKSGPERAQLVRAFTRRACDIGDDIGCAWYAEDLELGLRGDVDLAEAKRVRLIACEHGHDASCDSRS